MPSNERQKELKRRRHRAAKYARIEKKLGAATVSEKAVIAEKLRRMTPGADVLIERWELEKRA